METLPKVIVSLVWLIHFLFLFFLLLSSLLSALTWCLEGGSNPQQPQALQLLL